MLSQSTSISTIRGQQLFQTAPVTLAPKPALVPNSIYIVATGGTIAGTAASSTTGIYRAAALNANYLTAAIPELNQYGIIHPVDLFQIDSSDMTTTHWIKLANEINQLLKQDDIKGVVVTHGTDTLEETAYFLDLVIKSSKPVVLVGAMRNSTSLSADGQLNLLNAVAVINNTESSNRGVMVVMNDVIYDGRDVTKTHTTQVNAFSAPNSGPIGHVIYGNVEYEKKVTRQHTINTPFDISELTDLPTVEIVYEYAGSNGKLLAAAIKSKPNGIVIAGTGDGNIPARDKALMTYARNEGIQIIRSSRTGSGRVTFDSVDHMDTDIGLISGDNLNPQKARILLMLSLTKSNDVLEIRRNFGRY